jgi:AcrR family transcriptional regulator
MILILMAVDIEEAGMARKSNPPKAPKIDQDRAPRERIVDALMELSAEGPYGEIGIAAIAERAGVTLAEFRDLFPSKGAILAAFAKRIDRVVLEGLGKELEEEPVRERVLDIMMRRFDALLPYRDALRSISRDMRGEPLAMAAMNKVAINSQRFMLAAAGVDTQDPLGPIKVQGAVAVFARAFQTFLEDDEEEGLTRTMARLDRELDKGERLLRLADDVHALTAPFRAFFGAMCQGRRRFGERMRERRRAPRGHEDDGEPEAA